MEVEDSAVPDGVAAGSEVAAEVSHSATWTLRVIRGPDVLASEREGHDGSDGEADSDGLNAGRALVEDGDGSQRGEHGVERGQDRVDREGALL